eukprot:CAMPEP_0167813684 /NCGR_PEP_ID=MMETSP0112_2-20121227/1992_1 /TAXON_ID=91324 /ORGANISM="Lotharella globosa, Strain CCCM811" /LENGTH=33 /DNA_ID= /DNA_START= /DNA_END= /DNA_ORIENTATION=
MLALRAILGAMVRGIWWAVAPAVAAAGNIDPRY